MSNDSAGIADLRSVADGASLHYLGTVVVNVVGFLLNLLLTRLLGASVYGIYAYGTMILNAVLLFATVGTDVSITKYLSANRDDPAYQRRMLGLAYLTTIVGSLVTAAIVYTAAPTITAHTLEEPMLTTALRIFAIALPFQALGKIASSTVRGLEKPTEKTVIMVVGPTIRLVAIAAAVALGYSLLGIAAAFAVAAVMAALFGIGYSLSRTDLRPSGRFSRSETTEFYNFSAPLTLSKASSFLFKRVDVFMVGFLLASADVGIYNIAVLLAGVIAMPLAGFNQFFPPVASRLYSNAEYDTLESIYATVTRWSITASVAIALPLYVYRTEVLTLFGPEFVAGTLVVTLFIAGQLFNAAAGPANDLLTMTDHQYLVMGNHFVFGVCNVVLNYYFIVEFGLIGAALATAAVLATLNVVRVLEVWYLEGLFAYSPALWKPCVATAVSAAVMYGLRLYLDGPVVVFVGGAAGTAAFLGTLYLLGLDEQDIQIADEYLGLVS
ncbi:oligosaccharide flippase family protein [Haloterrigena sp. SYSU A558-1]|uniref:Oligosaccharide flippase family protein n=1 Tax=Haloterrigena gelatinilytica TaxID=2741724 RepID=A0A8J8GQ07_9EURY|nr:oligosaccharide flippase family protein [Haloterrigena gelatinilytica]NUB92467.1 oligosaccharide flippase family protein [Haloterrigena gelatinilytica]NUC71616.1 oligosaccharide flippase family protein [Haloterrigena gelatinilytica]